MSVMGLWIFDSRVQPIPPFFRDFFPCGVSSGFRGVSVKFLESCLEKGKPIFDFPKNPRKFFYWIGSKPFDSSAKESRVYHG